MGVELYCSFGDDNRMNRTHKALRLLRLIWPVFVAALFTPLASARVLVDARTTIFVDAHEPLPIQKAVNDLASDWKAVFGKPARIVNDPASVSGTTLWVAFSGPLPNGVTRPSGWERLLIQNVSRPSAPARASDAIVLTGSDMRGAIYAIYQFSQQFLGIDPLYWWTDHQPEHRSRIELPSELHASAAPRFRYRGWFLNDEDLFTGWTPGAKDGTGISLDTWDHVYEALLRLKGNMVVPGTWIFPYEPQIKAAVDRGLVVTQHHVNVLGLDTYRWPKNQPYSFSFAPQLLESAMRRALNQYPHGAEVICSVGYRGQNDYPFWFVDKNAPTTDEGRAKIIRAAIDKEMEIAKQLRGNSEIVLNAWREAAQFIHEGFLKVPPGVTLVWPDNGHGLIEDKGQIAAGQGIYYHTAMFDYFSNHYTEMLPIERIQRELGRAVKAGATQFLLVNTSNLRPVVMTTRAVMELAWNPEPWQRPDAPSLYLHKWSQEELGKAAADSVAAYYQAYAQAPARYGEKEDAVMQDNFYQTAALRILLHLVTGDVGSPVKLGSQLTHDYPNVAAISQAMLSDCREADGRWRKASDLATESKKLVPPDRLPFFQAHVLTQLAIHEHSNRLLEAVAEAALAASKQEKMSALNKALVEGAAIEAAFEAADYGKWRNFYTAGDWLLDVPRTLALVRAYQDKLEGRPVPENAIIRAKDGGFAYWMITAYQGTQQVQF